MIWEKKKGGDAAQYTLLQPYHEPDGEYVGHLRVATKSVMIVNGFVMPAREDGQVRDFQLESSPMAAVVERAV